MSINAYILSPSDVPWNQVLFPTMIPTFRHNGIVPVSRIEECDIVLMDLHSRISSYIPTDIEYICNNKPFVATFDEWDRGNMSTDLWPEPLTKQQDRVFNLIFNGEIKSVHFCRLLDKTKKQLVQNIYPYEKPILYEEPILTTDELSNRPFDVCMICNTSPNREDIAKAIRNDGRFHYITSIGEKKIPFDKWVGMHRKASFFISSSAGGFSNERIQNLFSIAAICQEKTNQLILNPLTHLENCIEISPSPTKHELDTLFEVIESKDRLYSIYKNGYEFIKKYYNADYIAQNIARKIKKHLEA